MWLPPGGSCRRRRLRENAGGMVTMTDRGADLICLRRNDGRSLKSSSQLVTSAPAFSSSQLR